MSSDPKTDTNYPTTPAHGDVHRGEVYSGLTETWMSRAEFDALYPPRSQFMYQDDWR